MRNMRSILGFDSCQACGSRPVQRLMPRLWSKQYRPQRHQGIGGTSAGLLLGVYGIAGGGDAPVPWSGLCVAQLEGRYASEAGL